MKRLLIAGLLLVASVAGAANVDYHSLITDYFTTNGYYVGVKLNTNQFSTNASGINLSTNISNSLWSNANISAQSVLQPIDQGRNIWANKAYFQGSNAIPFYVADYPVDPPGTASWISYHDSSVGDSVFTRFHQESDFNDSQPFGYFDVVTGTNVVSALLDLEDGTRASAINLNVASGPAASTFSMSSNSVNFFGVNPTNVTLQGIRYAWPSTNATAGQALVTDGATPQHLFWTNFSSSVGVVTNFATTNTDAGLTNAFSSIITNKVPNFIHGTSNYVAKFTPNTNEVGNSIVIETATNQWEWRSLVQPTAWTNNITNRIYGEWTNPTNWTALDIVSSMGIQNFHEIHGVQGASHTTGIPPLKLMGSVYVEPSANPLGGHTAGNVTPASTGSQALGTTSAEWHGVYSDALGFRAEDITALSGNHQFYSVSQGIGMSTAGIEFDTIADGFCGGVQRDSTTALRGFVVATAGNGIYGAGTGGFAIDTFMTRGTVANTWSFSTNNSATAAPAQATLEGGEARGTDHPGSDLIIAGGYSTGLGRSGAAILATADSATASSSSVNTGLKQVREYVSAKPVVLTNAAVSPVFNVAIASGTTVGFLVTATTTATNSVDFAVVNDHFSVSAANKAGTVTASVSASVPQSTLTTSGTLTTAWTAVANGNGLDIKCNANASMTAPTNSVRWRVVIDPGLGGTGVITPQ